jgi:hypothetical protein
MQKEGSNFGRDFTLPWIPYGEHLSLLDATARLQTNKKEKTNDVCVE